MPAKRILLVDDQRSVTSLLRAALETLGRDYIVVEVPSGEEALLEIGRGGADLLVVDVRLPGISGLDVVRRLRRTNSQAQVIVMSGMPDAQIETEARNLQALAFLRKPISMDTFLPVATRALGEQPPAPAAEAADIDQPAVSERLSTLRRDLGADAVYLVDMQGRVTMRAGDITRIDLDPVMAEVVTAMDASLKVSRLLGGLIPSNVHFFDGDEFDVYAANVGQFYAIVIIFDGDRGAGQMGPVMRYGRQCADDLLNSLVMLGVKMDEPAAVAAPAAAKAPPAGRPSAPAPATTAPAAAPAPPPRPKPAPPPAPPPKPLTEAELKALDDALVKVKSQDADAFWDSFADSAEDQDVRADGLSFEDAEKMGLMKK
jgi:CheY-like chemotaxis protein